MSKSIEDRYDAVLEHFDRNILPNIKIVGETREKATLKFTNHSRPAEERLVVNRHDTQALDIALSA